jgi:hypothetical protein
MTGWADQVLSQKLRYVDGTIQGTMTHNPNDTCRTCAMEAVTITQSQRRMQNPCHRGHDNREGRSLSPEGPVPKAFGSAVRDARFPKHFERQATLSSMTAKLNLVSSWRTTTLRAERAK